MNDLKRIRTKLGVTQVELAQRLGISAPAISLYEAGVQLPDLENMILIERELSEAINWDDQLTANERHELVNHFSDLIDKYPTLTVMKFVDKYLKQGIKHGKPLSIIRNFRDLAYPVEPLMPSDFRRTK